MRLFICIVTSMGDMQHGLLELCFTGRRMDGSHHVASVLAMPGACPLAECITINFSLGTWKIFQLLLPLFLSGSLTVLILNNSILSLHVHIRIRIADYMN